MQLPKKITGSWKRMNDRIANVCQAERKAQRCRANAIAGDVPGTVRRAGGGQDGGHPLKSGGREWVDGAPLQIHRVPNFGLL
jgi:hypothetical protein